MPTARHELQHSHRHHVFFEASAAVAALPTTMPTASVSAFSKGKGVRLFHDDKPSANSPVADLVRAYQIKSENVIAHIRKASQGQTSLANTHPSCAEMWGEYWLFAHNGHLIDFPEQVSTTMPSVQPIPNAHSALSSTACAAALPPNPNLKFCLTPSPA